MHDDHEGHSHIDAPLWFFVLAFALNAPFFFAGWYLWAHSGSIAILGDAIHNFFHAVLYLVALLVPLWGNEATRKRRQMQAGIGIGALILLSVPLIVALGALSIIHPVEVVSRDMFIMSTLDLTGEVILGGLALRIEYHRIPMRKIYLVQAALGHILIDALGSIGVLAGALFIWKLHFYSADGIAALFIAGIGAYVGMRIIRKARRELRGSVDVHSAHRHGHTA